MCVCVCVCAITLKSKQIIILVAHIFDPGQSMGFHAGLGYVLFMSLTSEYSLPDQSIGF